MRIRMFLILLMAFTGTLAFGQKVDMSRFDAMQPRNIGPAGMSGRVTAIAVNTHNAAEMYIGTASGGIWKTTNEATTFTPVFDQEQTLSIGAIAIDPLRPEVIWAGTGEGNPRNSLNGGYGLYKSIDGGKSWKLMGLEKTRHIHRILIHPHNPDVVYVGAIGSPWMGHPERGVYKTTDGGKTWDHILYLNEHTGVADMIMDPSNPDKIFVAMWYHQRWPWFFTSGGEGSGIYLTRNGGEDFEKLEEGLPGEIGRVGLTIPKVNPNYVYAYVESKTNAIYRSTDGGKTWEMRGDRNVGSRPFYYAEIHADPANENRLYTLHSRVAMSIDGGKTFDIPIANSVHSDHHAWWIHPENPAFMIDGNDGGMAITHDMGKTWRHIENLPVGQFYHVRVDMEKPYNVYGGMQDNGSWIGPAYKYSYGGIINTDWQFLIGGDGFDAVPIPNDPRYCYAQSQQGHLQRVDLLTGKTTGIRPAPRDGETLRFNWNAAIAQDPFDDNTLYFGSQFVHKSTDRGDSWEKISEDLTTNDPEKQKQRSSGGLTIDATGAENHTTILSIAPSPLEKGLLWVGTDDGNLQLTRDGGETWTNLTDQIKDAPEKAWIGHIHASNHEAGEAFVVINNYRVGDYTPYLFHTKNYGKSWNRIADEQQIFGYVLSVVQDPVEPSLLFMGTENGLFVSFDYGSNWNQWTAGFPSVSTYDLAIHPREHDLIMATFGRSIWVLDDIRPLREIAAKGTAMLDQPVNVFPAPEAVQAESKNNPGYYFTADAMFEGANRPISAMITCYIHPDVVKDTANMRDQMHLEIYDKNGNLFRKQPISQIREGMNRLYWRFNSDPYPRAGTLANSEQSAYSYYRRGISASALPGEYTVKVVLGERVSENSLTVAFDPRLHAPDASLVQANLDRAREIAEDIKVFNAEYETYMASSEIIKNIETLVKDMEGEKKEALNLALNEFKKEKRNTDRKFTNREDGLLRKSYQYAILITKNDRLSENDETSVKEATDALEEGMRLMKEFQSTQFTKLKEELKAQNISLADLF